MNFYLSFKEKGTTGATADFQIQVGRMKGTPGSAVLLPEIQVLDSDVIGGNDITPILSALTVGDEYDVYVGMYVNEDNKLGFDAKVIDTGTHENHPTKALLFKSTLGTGCGFAICCRTDDNTPTKLCIPNFTTTGIGNERLADEDIMSMTDLKRVLGIFRTSYQTKETSLYTRGMWLIDTAFLVNIQKVTDGQVDYWKSAVPIVMNYAQYNCSIRQSYMNMRSFWNWYSFLTGEFYLPVQYVETSDDKKIYLSTPITPPDDEMIYYDSVDYPFQSNLAADGQPAVAWDYQSGSDLLEFVHAPGDSIVLKSGAILQLKKTTDGLNRRYFTIELIGSVGQENYNIKSAFNLDGRIGDMVEEDYAVQIDFYTLDKTSNYDVGINNPYFNSPYETILLRGIYLVETPYDENGIGNYARENAGQSASFFNKYPTTPIAFAGVYTSKFETNYKGESYAKRAETWGFDNVMADIMVCNVGGYKTPADSQSGEAYRKVINLFTNCKPSDTITTFVNGGNMKVDSYEGWSALFGIVGAIDPEDPDSGEGSIGGGGGGTHEGGHGTYDDTGDNIDFHTTHSYGTSNSVTNWYMGPYEGGDTYNIDADTNLNLLGDWLRTTPDPDASNPLAGMGYKYSDKLANICSLKLIYAPTKPNDGVLSGPLVPKIHGQVLHGGSEQPNPVARKVTNQHVNYPIISNFRLDEYFGSFLDYAPYTRIQIFLPFAGVHDLNPSDVMGKRLSIAATVDLITADIVYNIKVYGETCESILYTFYGNTGVDLPFTATDYSGKIGAGIQTILGAATMIAGVAGASYTGGASLGLVGAGAQQFASGGVQMGLAEAKTYTKGSVGGSVGALSPMQCYLIVTRPKKVEAKDYGDLIGYPCMKSYTLADLKGFVMIHEAHWAIPGATEAEIDEIASLMRDEGAIL